MRWISSLADLVHRVLCLYTLLIYALCYWVFSSHWVAGFLMMTLPLLLVLHLVIVVFGGILGARKNMVISLIMLLIAYPFWIRTIGFGKSENETPTDFRVINYNIHQLGYQVKNDGETPLISPEGLNWLKEMDAGILCFQEFLQEKPNGYDMIDALNKMGYQHFMIMHNKLNRKPKKEKGLAIFSRYKIVSADQEGFGGQNGIMKADIVIGDDTITVINAHLQSMTLNLRSILEQKEVEHIRLESQDALRRIKKGFERRDEQFNILELWVRESKYPVIVCGDFNEIPYSYTYGRLSKILKNSFEAGGKGFGFSYRRLPYFIRIDNQFYDPDKISLNRFETVRTANFSDHYPLIGDYALKRKEG